MSTTFTPTSGTTFDHEVPLALAALKGKLHDPADGPRYWGVDGSVPGGRLMEHSGHPGAWTSTPVPTGDMRPWDMIRLADAMNEAFKAAQAAA